MSTSKQKLFLLDAMALIYRAYFALNRNPRINSKGLNTSAILGFTNTLFDVLKNENPEYIGVAFDMHAPTLRHESFAEYKANREEIPEDIAKSIPIIKEIIKGFNIPILEKAGYEADDLIGTLAKKAEKEGFVTYMMTPDKDYGQLVSENIFMYRPSYRGSGVDILGIEEINEKFNIRFPEQVIDLLGLWGDASDNIPGVPGIGEKTASTLLQQFDTLEEMIENPEKIEKERIRKKIIDHTEQAKMSKQLATIILDAPVDFDAEALKRSEPDITILTALFDELEFRTMAKRMFGDMQKPKPTQPDLFSGFEVETTKEVSSHHTIENTTHQYHLIDTPEKRKQLIEKLAATDAFCYDTETTGLQTTTDELIGIAFAITKGEAYYVNLPQNVVEAKSIVQEFKAVFENDSSLKIGQNLKFDNSIMKWYDVQVAEPFFDTMLAHYLIEPEQKHSLDYLAETYLHYKTISYESLVGKKGKNQKTLRNVDIEKVVEYAAEDADITLQLKEILEPLLKESNVERLYQDIEIPLIDVLSEMEANGVKLNTEAIKEISGKLAEDIIALKQKIYAQAGEEFNISSPKQLGVILYEKIKVTDKPKLTKTKQYSTSEEVLRKLASRSPIIADVLEYRQLTKLKSTYVDALPDLISTATNRIHTSYNQMVTATGRLSSTNPNLQNIPIRTERGREIRKAFVPRDENHMLLAADYSQIELRIMAALSGDEGLIEAFRKGLDIHTATAAKINHVPVEEVDSDMRRKAKTANFGIIYGISAFGLSERLNIARKEASELIKTYFEQYPMVKKYMDESVAFAKEHGYVETIMKRRRYLRDIQSGNAVVRGVAERNAINAPIQGSSADMIKIAMINIHRAIKNQNLKSKMILQVHDELVFDTPQEEVEQLTKLVVGEMKNAMELTVPIVVDHNTGTNWLEAH